MGLAFEAVPVLAPLLQCPDPFLQYADKSRQPVLIGPNLGLLTIPPLWPAELP